MWLWAIVTCWDMRYAYLWEKLQALQNWLLMSGIKFKFVRCQCGFCSIAESEQRHRCKSNANYVPWLYLWPPGCALTYHWLVRYGLYSGSCVRLYDIIPRYIQVIGIILHLFFFCVVTVFFQTIRLETAISYQLTFYWLIVCTHSFKNFSTMYMLTLEIRGWMHIRTTC